VTLEADGDATLLTYTVDAQIGGKLAQLGGRLIDATAKNSPVISLKIQRRCRPTRRRRGTGKEKGSFWGN